MEGIEELLTDIRWALKTFNSRLALLVPSDVVVLKQRRAALGSPQPSNVGESLYVSVDGPATTPCPCCNASLLVTLMPSPEGITECG